MSRRSTVLVFVVVCASAACGSRAPRPEPARGDPVVLELGGDAVPIREVLRRSAPPGAPAPTVEPGPRAREGRPEALGDPRTLPDRPPTTAPAGRFRTVELQAGQTLYDLCQTWLGDGARWPEVMELNGWTEARTRRLPTGQKVKLPVE